MGARRHRWQMKGREDEGETWDKPSQSYGWCGTELCSHGWLEERCHITESAWFHLLWPWKPLQHAHTRTHMSPAHMSVWMLTQSSLMFSAFRLVDTLTEASWLGQYAPPKGASTWREAWFWCIYVLKTGARRQSRTTVITSSRPHINTDVTEGTRQVQASPRVRLSGTGRRKTIADLPGDITCKVVRGSKTISKLSPWSHAPSMNREPIWCSLLHATLTKCVSGSLDRQFGKWSHCLRAFSTFPGMLACLSPPRHLLHFWAKVAKSQWEWQRRRNIQFLGLRGSKSYEVRIINSMVLEIALKQNNYCSCLFAWN